MKLTARVTKGELGHGEKQNKSKAHKTAKVDV